MSIFKNMIVSISLVSCVAVATIGTDARDGRVMPVHKREISVVQGGTNCKWAWATTVAGVLFFETGAGMAAAGAGGYYLWQNCL